jgi:hypothetical protein
MREGDVFGIAKQCAERAHESLGGAPQRGVRAVGVMLKRSCGAHDTPG